MDGKGNICLLDMSVSISILVILKGGELFNKNVYSSCSSLNWSLISVIRSKKTDQLSDIYPEINKAKKFPNHLWQLVPETDEFQIIEMDSLRRYYPANSSITSIF